MLAAQTVLPSHQGLLSATSTQGDSVMRTKVVLVLTFLLFSISNAHASTQKVLYTFTGGLDGGQPYQASVIFDQSGNLYGVTEYGGVYNWGTVFQLTPSPSGEWTETVLHSFTGGADGDRPQGGLAIDGSGNLYGTTSDGGDPGVYCGTVFSLSPSESGWTFTVLHTFTGGKDGCSPQADVSNSDLLRGTTAGGGCGQQGTVFEMSTSGAGYYVYCFAGNNGMYPGGLGDCGGWVCGTSYYGGAHHVGNVWHLFWERPPSNIHAFSAQDKLGYGPIGNLVSQTNECGEGGIVYGTTFDGGAGSSGEHSGTVYQLALKPNRFGECGWSSSALHSFPASLEDGQTPWAGLALDAAGNLYGTTMYGPRGSGGMVFMLTPSPSTWLETVLYGFTGGADGGTVTSPVVLDQAGNLYGTTTNGGAYNQGVVFEVTPPTITTMTLTSSLNPSTHGQAVTFTAVVTSSTGAPPDGETVSFFLKSKVLGTGLLSGGSASFIASKLPVGTDSITAVYGVVRTQTSGCRG